VVGRGIPSPHNKMLGSFELEQAQALEKAGLDVVYIGISVRSAQNLRNVGFSTNDDFSIPAYSFNFPIGRAFSQTITDKIFNTAFSVISKKIVKEHGMPDIIHIHYPAQRPYDCLRKMQAQGVKIVATEHWTKVQDMTIGEIPRRNLVTFVSECNSFICVSSALKKSVIELTGTSRRIEVVPNLVNSVFITKPKKTDNSFTYVVSGRLVEHKQVDKVVQAFIKVFNKDEDVTLTIAGGGEQYTIIKGIIEKESREEQIHLLGPVSREKMANIMASSDALITYSRMETFCVPVIEAWMCGKPVIASETIPVMIDNPDDRLGLTVDEYKTEALESALVKIIKMRADYDADYIKNYAMHHFSEDSIASRLIEIYESIGV
jgi:glycosyltransferase involved in cell wall biosynthesis